jgi:hypothetical protein
MQRKLFGIIFVDFEETGQRYTPKNKKKKIGIQ